MLKNSFHQILQIERLFNFGPTTSTPRDIMDEASVLNGSKEPLGFDGITDVEVERRLKEPTASSNIPIVINPNCPINNPMTNCPIS
ncbi:hypothetical protein L2E82_29759 [Cichorium intybus]|uniref:Uncharacterized protein n=1 Tax=Cichorium intybus TaxID=13427 RepID=A0ACB9CYQ9_CICIN|nr:hypothetical protein L2E82_29759 [Cichorium intybus]